MVDPTAAELIARLQRNPQDAPAFAALRNHYAAIGDYVSLANLLEGYAQRVQAPEQAAEVFFEAGELWLGQLGNRPRAATAYQRALERYGVHPAAGARLEQIYRDAGDDRAIVQILERRADSLARLDTSGASNRQIASIHHQLGEMWEQRFQRADRAISHYRKAFELDPSLVVAVYAAREIYRTAGNFKAAAVLYDLEANAEPDPKRKVALYRELAHLRSERLGDLEGAVVALKRALALAPGDLPVMHELSTVLLRRAEQAGPDAGHSDRKRAADLLYQMAQMVPPDHAVAYLEAALDHVPDHDGVLALLEQHAEAAGRPDLMPGRWVAFLQAAPDAPGSLEMRRRLGYAYIEAGQAEDAIVCLEPLRDAGDAEAAGVLVDLYRSVGRTDQLAHTIGVQLARLPATERVPRLRELAGLLLAEGKQDEARERMNEILALDPSDPEAIAFLEDDYRGRGDFASLRDLLLNAVRVPGVSLESRKMRLREVAGISETRIGDVEGAISAWRALAGIDPGDVEVRTQLRRLLEQAQRWDDLVKLLEREALSSTDAEQKTELYRTLARLHREQRGDLREAVIALRHLRDLAPSDSVARDALCDVLEELGEYLDAKPLLRIRADEAPPGLARVGLNKRLARILEEELTQDDEAFAASARVLDDVPDDHETLSRMERIDERNERWDRLIETLGYRVEVTPDARAKAQLHARMAEIADRRLGDAERAIEYLTKAHDLFSGDPTILGGLSELYERLGRFEDLIVLLESRAKTETDPRMKAEIYRRIARVLALRLHNDDAAAEAWIEVLRAGEDAEALDALAMQAEKHGDDETLVDALDRLAVLSTDPETRRNLLVKRADVLAERLERPQEAIEVLREVAQIDREYTPAMASLASLCERTGDLAGTADALEMQLVATRDAGLRVPLASKLANLYEHRLDNPERAAAALEAWTEADPTDADVLTRLLPIYERLGRWREVVTTLDGLAGLVGDETSTTEMVVRTATILEQRIGDVDAAWSRLQDYTVHGHEECEQELRALADRTGRNEQLGSLYVRLAQGAAEVGDGDLTRRRWQQASEIYETRVGDTLKALEATLRAFATDLGSDTYLDDVDRLAVAAAALPRLSQVYEALIRQTDDPSRKVTLLLRHSDALAHGAGDASAAFDEVLRAAALVPNDPAILRHAEELAAASGRGEDLLVVYDRRRAAAESYLDRVDSLVRAARVADSALGDRERAFMYLQQAVSLLAREPAAAEMIEQAAGAMDADRPGHDPEQMRRALCGMYREAADNAVEDPELAGALLVRSARVLLDELGDVETAFAALKEAASMAPGEDAILDALERIAERTRWWVAVADHYGTLVEEALDQKLAISLLRRRGRIVLEVLDRPEEAPGIFEQLLVLDPSDLDAADRLRHCLKRAGRHQDFLAALERDLELRQDAAHRVELLCEVARTWEGPLRNRYEAIDAWRRVQAEAPGDAEARDALMRLGQSSRQLPIDEVDDDLLEELSGNAIEMPDDGGLGSGGDPGQDRGEAGSGDALLDELSGELDGASDAHEPGRRELDDGGLPDFEDAPQDELEGASEPGLDERSAGELDEPGARGFDEPTDDDGLDRALTASEEAAIGGGAPVPGDHEADPFGVEPLDPGAAGSEPLADELGFAHPRDDVIHIDDEDDESLARSPFVALSRLRASRGEQDAPLAQHETPAAFDLEGLSSDSTSEVGLPRRREEDTASLLARVGALEPMPEVRTGVLPPERRPDAMRPPSLQLGELASADDAELLDPAGALDEHVESLDDEIEEIEEIDDDDDEHEPQQPPRRNPAPPSGERPSGRPPPLPPKK